MRLMEVGTKQQSLGNKEQAYDLFSKAYDLYCLFWGLNMNMLSVDDVKWVKDCAEDVKRISEKVAAAVPAATETEIVREKAKAGTGTVREAAEALETGEEGTGEPQTAFARMKTFVRKAVDCCIE